MEIIALSVLTGLIFIGLQIRFAIKKEGKIAAVNKIKPNPKQEKRHDEKAKNKEKRSALCCNRCKISVTMPPKYLAKYNIKVGDMFASFNHLAEYVGLNVVNAYRWYNNRWIDIIQ